MTLSTLKHISLIYDGTFEGLLSAVFYTFESKIWPVSIVPFSNRNSTLFDEYKTIDTDYKKSDRVWNGLNQILTSQSSSNLFKAFLSKDLMVEMHILKYIQITFASKVDPKDNFSDASVLKLQKITKRINQEVHRMYAFVRFKKSNDNIYYAEIEPDFDVLPLISSHFERRYADQQWLIYDVKRSYGIYYDLKTVSNVSIEPFSANSSRLRDEPLLDKNEELYKVLWQTYFNSVNIAERKNTKLQLRHMPKRYWKYLSETKK